MNANFSRSLLVAITALAAATVIVDAAASGRAPSVPDNARWREECGSCHVPYPPQLLPARSWHAIMERLDRHFGTNANLDPQSRAEIGAFLQQNAGGSDRYAPTAATPLRITETRWFRHEHSEIRAPVWAGPNVRTAANCGACHRDAARGDYGERTTRLPE
jgi:hypothetical protein